MIEIFDRARRRVAIAENAYAISENPKINAVGYFYFSLPYSDQKNEYCKPFYYVRHNEGDLYRIMPETLSVEESGGIAYQCEHVIATLIDNVLFGYHVVGNLGTYTADVIRYVLDHQLVKNWVLDECDYRNQFEYGWEQESLLSALFSIASPLSGPYIWKTDTSVYPWRLSLKKLDTTGRPEMYVRRHHNMAAYRRERDPQNIVTRLYPLGYGEGVNQLNIKSVNGGVPYLQSPKSVTDKYGIIERVWTDRRYEDPASLMAAAQGMLEKLQEPLVSYEIGFQEMTGSDFDKAAIGKRVRIVYPEIGESVDTFITEIKRDFEDVEKSSLVVANRETSIASTVADMADRQRIESTYAQGATQIYSQALQANCDSSSGATMDFFIPQEMRIINKVLIKVRLGSFRAYSKSTQSANQQVITSTSTEDTTKTSTGGGKTTQTTTTTDDTTKTSTGGGKTTQTTTTTDDTTKTSTGGGKTTQTTTSTDDSTKTSTSGGGGATTSDSGGGGSTTSESGGSSTVTSNGGGGTTKNTGKSGINVEWAMNDTTTVDGHKHQINLVKAHQHAVEIPDHTHAVNIPPHTHTVKLSSHSHSVTIPSHSHNVTIPGHSHKVTIPDHSHNVTIPGHSHKVTIPDHTHNVTIPGHKHSVTIPDHTHNVTIPGHSHKVTVPAHGHNITPGIYTYGNPGSFALYVNGVRKASFSGRTAELDITAYLVGSNKLIPRGSWLSLEIRPDDLAYVSIDLIIQGFIQSRGDNTV